jgi:hypothetical protein
MRHARTERTCYSGTGHEFINFPRKDELLNENKDLVQKIINQSGEPFFNGSIKSFFMNYRNSYQWKNCSTHNIVSFLKKFNHFESERSHKLSYLASYIEKVNRNGELKDFTISLLGNGSGEEEILFNKYKVNLMTRATRGSTEEKLGIGVVTNEKLEGIDLLEDEYKKYMQSIENYKKTKGEKKIEITKRNFIRYHRSELRGNLNIYPIIYADRFTSNPFLVYAISLSLPNTRLSSYDSSIEYKVNPIYSRAEENVASI